MSGPTLEVVVMAAEELKNVNMLGKMSVYAVVWMDLAVKRSTHIRHKAGRNPVWNDAMSFPIDDHILLYPHSALSVQVYSAGTLSPTLVGSANLPLTDIARMKATKADSEEGDVVTLPLHRPSGRTQGILRISVNLTGASIQQMMYALGEYIDKGQNGWALEMPSATSLGIAEGVAVMGYPVVQSYGTPASFHPLSCTSYYNVSTTPSVLSEPLSATSSSRIGSPAQTLPPARRPPAVPSSSPHFPSELNLNPHPLGQAQYVPVETRRQWERRGHFLLALILGSLSGVFYLGTLPSLH